MSCYQDYVKAIKTGNKNLTHKEALKIASMSYKQSKKQAIDKYVCQPVKRKKVTITPKQKEPKKEPIIKKKLIIAPKQKEPKEEPKEEPKKERKKVTITPKKKVPEEIYETAELVKNEPIETMLIESGVGLSDIEKFRQNPNIQFAPRGVGFSDIEKFRKNPNIQNVDILSKMKPLRVYGTGGCCGMSYHGMGALNTAVIVDGLEKSGIFQASKDVLKGLTKKFNEWLEDPSKTRQHRIITRIIPDLTYKYDRLKNELEVYGSQWKPLRINNHKLAMLNTEDKIKSLLMELKAL